MEMKATSKDQLNYITYKLSFILLFKTYICLAEYLQPVLRSLKSKQNLSYEGSFSHWRKTVISFCDVKCNN